ncbi:hypothetical protein VN24_18875 [Paenibacillus beijingensis]|uniref:DUF58 domain-containing protein n=2 Tax=Paenibacillus beijingensis TaxID=1126833 RepID=A0A0D5NRD5_9BACL|nr:hypothetical protein VN24_18875 [Paenibacillus beijingensis]
MRTNSFRWLLFVVIDVFSLLYMLFQGGKTAVMLFCILNGLLLYLGIGFWSGLRNAAGDRRIHHTGAKEPGSINLSAGSPVEVKLQVRIPGYYPVPYVIVRDKLERHNGEIVSFETSFVPGVKRSGEAHYTTPPLSRGMYRFLETECSTRDVFGFFEHKGRFLAEAKFSVRPRTVPLRGWERINRGARGPYSFASSSLAAKETTQINGIREYLPGDRLTRIHWNASARTGEWKSKAFERESLPRTFVVLDCWQQPGNPASAESFELAVSVAASLFQYGMRGNTTMGFFASSAVRAGFAPRGGEAQLHAVMELLTRIDADGREPIASAIGHAETLIDPGSIVFLITSSGTEEVQAAMNRLNKRGISPCLIQTDVRAGGIRSVRKGRTRDRGWPVFDISRLQELPSVLEGKEAAYDAGG